MRGSRPGFGWNERATIKRQRWVEGVQASSAVAGRRDENGMMEVCWEEEEADVPPPVTAFPRGDGGGLEKARLKPGGWRASERLSDARLSRCCLLSLRTKPTRLGHSLLRENHEDGKFSTFLDPPTLL